MKKLFKKKSTKEWAKEIKTISEEKYENLKWILECQRTNEFRIIDIELVKNRPFYDSTWNIYTMQNGQLSVVNIVTSPYSKEEMLSEKLTKVKNTMDILALDEKNSIYYD